MDRIGSIDEALLQRAMYFAIVNKNETNDANDTPEAMVREEGYVRSLALHRQIGRSSVSTILYMEQYHLTQEFKAARSSIEMSSLKNAIDEIEAARDRLSLTDDPDGYRKMVEALAPQDKKKDLPIDIVRRCFASHKARLQDRIKHPNGMSDGQYAILEQRAKNIRQAERWYVEFQREILGSDWRPEKDYTKMPPLPSDDSPSR